jgi:tRNA threonylcarbamoyl adenosine modification protein YeaZ
MTPHPAPSPARGEGKSRHRFLAIETSSPRLSLAIGNETKTIAIYAGPHEWRHAESLFDGIKTLLRRARWPIQSLTGVAVSVGPGSFTGIRIGLAVARALGQSLRIPVVGKSALETMAAGAPAKAEWLAPQIDALRGQIFSGLFQRKSSGFLQRVITETMSSSPEWMKRVKNYSGRQSFWISPPKGCYPEAKILLDLARPGLLKAGPESYQSVLPLYIRKAAAEERRR